jgi:hypothetical protein
MTRVPIVYGPLSSFIDRDDQVDLELACLSNMSVTIIFSQTLKFTQSYWISFPTFLLWKKDELISANTSMPFLQSLIQALFKNPILFKYYHLDMSTSSKFMILCIAPSLGLVRSLFATGVRLTSQPFRPLRLFFRIFLYYYFPAQG